MKAGHLQRSGSQVWICLWPLKSLRHRNRSSPPHRGGLPQKNYDSLELPLHCPHWPPFMRRKCRYSLIMLIEFSLQSQALMCKTMQSKFTHPQNMLLLLCPTQLFSDYFTSTASIQLQDFICLEVDLTKRMTHHCSSFALSTVSVSFMSFYVSHLRNKRAHTHTVLKAWLMFNILGGNLLLSVLCTRVQ